VEIVELDTPELKTENGIVDTGVPAPVHRTLLW